LIMTIRRFIGNAAASACLALAGGILTTQAGEAAKPPPVLSALPGDPDELINACRMDPLLARWAGRGPGQPLEEGQQVMLLDDDKVPIADRPHVPWAKPLPGARPADLSFKLAGVALRCSRKLSGPNF
jgi:hypothetical protein